MVSTFLSRRRENSMHACMQCAYALAYTSASIRTHADAPHQSPPPTASVPMDVGCTPIHGPGPPAYIYIEVDINMSRRRSGRAWGTVMVT
jgi:hypothetical protein